MTPDFVTPSEIPWASIKGKDLEECLFWLLEAMGARDLQWRIGGEGDGAPDGGRDIECIFHVPLPSGDIAPQKWWIEAKGRKQTVEPSEVKASVLNAAGRADLDTLIVATNNRFSNPTKDWLANWLKEHPRPSVRLWEQIDLERYITRHPEVAMRLYPSALTVQGILAATNSKFWDYSRYAELTTLRRLWEIRATIEWNDRAIIACIVSEAANGDLSERPWAAILEKGRVTRCFIVAMLNIFYFVFRCDAAGIQHEAYIRGVAHLLLMLLLSTPARTVATLVENVWSLGKNFPDIPDEAKWMMLDPILATAQLELQDACTHRCPRVHTDRRLLSEDKIEAYWNRFIEPKLKTTGPDVKDKKEMYLTIETHKAKCGIGLKLNKKNGCPILAVTHRHEDLHENLSRLKTVLDTRLEKERRKSSSK